MNDIKRASFVSVVPLFLVLCASACSKDPRGPDPSVSDAATPTTTANATATPPAPAPADCAQIVASFAATRARGTTTCKTDADCACFNGIDAAAACGGVIDAKTARDLGALETSFHAKACRLSHQCAAQICDPGCDKGQCVMARKR